MRAEYHCPSCCREISQDDINVATDLALCRACDEVCKFSRINGEAKIALDVLDLSPASIRGDRDDDGNSRIVYRGVSPLAWLSVPTAIIWNGMLATLIIAGFFGETAEKPSTRAALIFFLTPFALVGLLLVGIMLWHLLGCWVIVLRSGGGSVFTGIGIFGWTWNFDLGPHAIVSLTPSLNRMGDLPWMHICIDNDEQLFTFGATIQVPAKNYLAAAILEAKRASDGND